MFLYHYHIYVYFRALGLPTTDLTYDDCKLMIRARQMNVPHFDDIVEIEKLRQEIGYDNKIHPKLNPSNQIKSNKCLFIMNNSC